MGGGTKSLKLLIVVAPLALIALAGGWLLFEQRPGAALDRFASDAARRMEAARPAQATADTFRATICAATPCVLVEAGGLAFLVGAGAGAADSLVARGLLRATMDGVLVNDLSLGTVEGLAGVQRAVFARRREGPLTVFGPQGVLTVVDGANLMLAGSGAEGARLQVGAEGEDQGLAGQIVFDSGVVTIRSFPAGVDGRIYRFDAGDKSLIVSGCGAAPRDILAAARGAKTAGAIVAAASQRLLEIEAEAAKVVGSKVSPAPPCMTSQEAMEAVRDARLAGGLIAPLIPAPRNDAGRKAWREAAAIPNGLNLAPGAEGATLDMTGPAPVLKAP
jgi:hypothetical protein